MSSRITKECQRGHVFEPDYPDSDDCPYCAQMERRPYQSKKTMPIYDAPPVAEVRPAKPRPVGQSKTVPLHATVGTLNMDYVDVQDPVVGWLVATAGPLRGQDFRVPSGRSSLGRDPSCRICIAGDPTVSSQQGYINYSRNRRFTISPGEGSSLLYVNGMEVLAPVELTPFTVIEMGCTKMAFIPFCGENFDWSVVEEDK